MIVKSIAACKIGCFNEKVNNLNKRLTRLGKPTLVVTETGRHISEITFREHNKGEAFVTDREFKRPVEFVDIQIDGFDFFKKDDRNYRYIGSINTEEGIKTVYCLDETLLDAFKKDENVCDHCKTARRRNVYHLFEVDGKVLRIGSTCSEQYFGYDVASILDTYLQTFIVIRDYTDDELYEEMSGGREYNAYTFREVYAQTLEATNNFTFWESGLGSQVREGLNRDYDDPYFQQKHDAPKFTYEEIKAFWDKPREEDSFVLNVRETLKRNYAVYKNVGIYSFAIFKAVKELSAPVAVVQVPIYKEGERFTLDVTVTGCDTYFKEFGYQRQTIHVREFVDSAGNIYETETQSEGASYSKTGDKINLTGTLKKTFTRRGVIHYVLTRCKFNRNLTRELNGSDINSKKFWVCWTTWAATVPTHFNKEFTDPIEAVKFKNELEDKDVCLHAIITDKEEKVKK